MTAPTLVILRHAKAERPERLADIDRPLTERGHADASAAGAWLASRQFAPDLVVCSPARRTRQTWHGVAVALAGSAAPQVHYDAQIYEAGVEALLALVRAAGQEFHTMLLIGHNPSVSLLSTILDPRASRDSDGLRTSGLAVHAGPAAWEGFGAGTAPLVAAYTGRA